MSSLTTEKVCLKACFECEAATAERPTTVEIEVEGTNKSVLSLSPCDSPAFYTPVGTPSRDGVSSEYVSPVSGN